ncbi:MAG: response regulator transcription factor [Dinghuibacter sp.]|nr:response regulator transcription factor [Dinghuibacter sp.]
MNILIVEDEELAVKKLQKTLAAADATAVVVGVTDSIKHTVQWLQEHPEPDLILMDIELADGQSFEIFNLFTVNSPVIFTTSYDEFALKAFKVNSLDYLLKPIQKDELEAALNKFRRLKSSSENNLGELVQQLRHQLQPKEYRKRFLVKHAQKLVSIEVNDVAFFYSDGRLNFFKTHDNKKFVVDYTMDELADMLNPDDFFRISRSFYVSIGSIEKIDDYFGNRLILGLKPSVDKEALVSREKVTDFKKWMGK